VQTEKNMMKRVSVNDNVLKDREVNKEIVFFFWTRS